MLGLFLIYFIGKQFYDLAFEHDKNKWGFAILGVISYYASSFIGAFIIVFGILMISPNTLDTIPDIALDLMAVPFGLLGCIGLYFFLRKTWEKQERFTENIIDEIGADHPEDF